MSWARSLPAPLRRPLSRLAHAAWEGAADLGAIGPDDPRGRRFGRMGAGACLLFPQGALYNEHLIHIGAETIVGPGASISAGMAPGQEMPTDPVVSIGSRTLIGRGSHIVGHWEIVIGDDIQTGPYVYITDQNHSYDDPVEPIGRQWPTEAPVRIGSGSWLGANAVILPGAQIGEHVVVAAGAVVRGEVPDRCVVAGVPARIVKRWVEGTGWVTEKDVAPSVTVPFLVTVSGQDGPGIAERLFAVLAERCIDVDDVEQVRVHGRLLLCVEAGMERAEAEPVRALLEDRFAGAGVVVAVDPLVEAAMDDVAEGHLVTLLAPEIDAATLETVTGSIARCGGNIVRILRLAAYPVHSYEFTVADADVDALRRALAEAAARRQVDVAVQAAGLHRRAKHLIVLDADSTLLQGEMIDLLADRCGCGPEVAAVTEAAMAGEIDFADALRQRVRLLAGLKEADLEAVRDGIVLTPGARTLVRTLKRLGYELAVVSGGFTQVIGPLVTELGIDHLAANELVVDGGVVTGELTGAIVDRAGKAEALVTFAAAAGVPVARTIAVGDGANDIDMLAAAGLGIAFNAKPVVREAADAALSVPYLDAILFLLGISRREVELADRLEEAGERVTVLAQGEQGRSADNRGDRPLLRGWLHAGAFFAWLIGGPFLIAAGPDAAATTELAIYVAGMLAMFGTSVAFHRLRWSAPAWRRMRRADHSAIFVGIAGTCTAVAGLALRGWAEVLILTLVWAGAAAGIALRQVFLDAPQWVVAVPYVLVGWCPIIVAPQLVRSLGWVGFASMLSGGLYYTVGALVYVWKKPDPWPRVFGFHEVFHACTLVGVGSFVYLVAFIALPAY